MSTPDNPDNTVLSRRRFCRFLSAAFFSVGMTPTFAVFPADPDPTPASLLHAQGVRLLVQGKRFERAAAFLELAAWKEPTDPAHPLALGCAYASRAASLIHAAQFSQMLLGMRAGYEDSLKVWEKDREENRAKDPQGFNEAEYEKSKPVSQSDQAIPTKDDNLPFHLTAVQIGSRVRELSAKALLAWETGIALSMTLEEKAQAYYIQGWGLRVLRQFIDSNSAPEMLKTEMSRAGIALKDLPTDKTVLAAFDKATIAAPDNPLYWQAKGDALGESDDAASAYLKALELQPRNATSLWYLLYRRVAPKSYEKPEKEWAIAAGYLQKAQARDRQNAWPLYEEAVLRFCDAPYILTGSDRNRITTPEEQEVRRAAVRNAAARGNGRRAIDLILQGNSAARYDSPRYVDSVPGMLAAAWGYRFPKDIDAKGFARSRELARSAGAYGKFMASDEKEANEAVRAVEAAIGMGRRMMGDWPVVDDPAAGKTVLSSYVGSAVISISYKELMNVYEILADKDHYDAVSAESTAFKKRLDAYWVVIDSYLKHSDLDAY